MTVIDVNGFVIGRFDTVQEATEAVRVYTGQRTIKVFGHGVGMWWEDPFTGAILAETTTRPVLLEHATGKLVLAR